MYELLGISAVDIHAQSSAQHHTAEQQVDTQQHVKANANIAIPPHPRSLFHPEATQCILASDLVVPR